MKTKIFLILAWSLVAFSDDSVTETIGDAPPLVESHSSTEYKTDDKTSSFLPSFSLRMDSMFAAASAINQGFSLPSIRLSLFGSVDSHLKYRLSLGQTREFSSVLLPQIMPVEAYLEFIPFHEKAGDSPMLRWKAGMFTPTLNPWWSPDLSDLDLPDYNRIHQSVFLSRDLGSEIIFHPFTDLVTLSAGYFNGSGIFGQNSNNSRTLIGYAEFRLPFDDDWGLFAGGNVQRLEQSDSTSVNFKWSLMFHAFVGIESKAIKARLTAEVIYGQFLDLTRSLYPTDRKSVV